MISMGWNARPIGTMCWVVGRNRD